MQTTCVSLWSAFVFKSQPIYIGEKKLKDFTSWSNEDGFPKVLAITYIYTLLSSANPAIFGWIGAIQ